MQQGFQCYLNAELGLINLEGKFPGSSTLLLLRDYQQRFRIFSRVQSGLCKRLMFTHTLENRLSNNVFVWKTATLQTYTRVSFKEYGSYSSIFLEDFEDDF